MSPPIEVVVIGLPTGGSSALEQLLPKLPKDFPVPVLNVQHMPKLFTGALAERQDKCCALRVEQAYDNATIRPGTVWWRRVMRTWKWLRAVRWRGMEIEGLKRAAAEFGCTIRHH